MNKNVPPIGHNQKIIIELTPEEAAHLMACGDMGMRYGLSTLGAISSRKNAEKVVSMVELWKSIRGKLAKEGVKDAE